MRVGRYHHHDGHDVMQVWARRSASDGPTQKPHAVSEVAPQELLSLRAPAANSGLALAALARLFLRGWGKVPRSWEALQLRLQQHA